MSKEIVLLGCGHPGHKMVSGRATVGPDGRETYGRTSIMCQRSHDRTGPAKRDVLARGQPGRIVYGTVLVGCRCDEDQGFDGQVEFDRGCAVVKVTEVSDCCPTCCETLKPWSFRADVCVTEGCNNVIDDSCYADNTCDECFNQMEVADRELKACTDPDLVAVWKQISEGNFRRYEPGHPSGETFGPLEGEWPPLKTASPDCLA